MGIAPDIMSGCGALYFYMFLTYILLFHGYKRQHKIQHRDFGPQPSDGRGNTFQ